MRPLPAIFCAIDTTDTARAVDLAAQVAQAGCGIKLGLEYFNAHGPDGIRRVTDAHAHVPLFLDLKYHDIPNTVAGAVRAACALAPAYMNVHAAGGLEMMKAAMDAARDESAKRGIAAPRMLAVTILTSLDDPALHAVGYVGAAADNVLRLAALTQAAGMDGIVCSAHEIAAVRRECGADFVLMVPGIRPAGADTGDQKRVMTPAQAMDAGATHLVIGRPITGAPDPGAAARAIIADMGSR
jgi:orotidine-5'-phosphate decarboxylase